MFCVPNTFSTVSGASGPVFMFWTPGLVFGGIEGVGSHFHVLRSRLVFNGTKGSGSRFHVLRSRAHFRRYGGRRVSISCIAQPDSFSAVPRASGPIFIFCAPNSFAAVPRESGPVFIFCAPEIVFGSTEGVRSRFHVFRSRTCFQRYRGRRVPFSCFPRPD
jgi:hypothetical protein